MRIESDLIPLNLLNIRSKIWRRYPTKWDSQIFKVGLSPSKKQLFYLFQWKPFKMMKNFFYFILKVFFVLKIFEFFSWQKVHMEKAAWLERLDSFQNLWRHNLVNKQLQYQNRSISHEVKVSQAIKFSQLIEYNKRNIFLQKSCREWGKSTSPRPLFVFFKKLYMR